MFTYRSVAQAALLNPPWLPSGGYLYTLDSYAYPLIGDLLVRDIGLPHVLAVLEPIWTKKTETASRLRSQAGMSAQALEFTILTALPHEDRNALMFASPRGGMLSEMSLTAVLRRMKVDAVPHGFRSNFRDWCAERTNYPREVAEMALAHAIGDKVEAAYRRGDLFEKRRRLMKDWVAFCANPETRKGSVISMNAARA